MLHALTASPKPSFKAPWRVGNTLVSRGNAGWIMQNSGHTCPCQNCSQRPPLEKTGSGSLLNHSSCPQMTHLSRDWTELKPRTSKNNKYSSSCSIYEHTPQTPWGGILDAKIRVPSAENPKLSKFSFFKAGAGQSITLHVPSTTRNSDFLFSLLHLSYTIHLFFPMFSSYLNLGEKIKVRSLMNSEPNFLLTTYWSCWESWGCRHIIGF